MRRLTILLALTAVSVSGPAGAGVAAGPPSPPPGALARPALSLGSPHDAWKAKLDRLLEGKTIGVSLREDGQFLYRRADKKRKVPASNEKLLLAMALLDRVDPDVRLETSVRAGQVGPGGVVPGNLWLIGRGDPSVGPGKLGNLVDRIEEAGITRVKGSVMGGISYFAHDWWAPGWKPYFPDQEIPLPSALTFKGNEANGKHVPDPERRAALLLTKKLRTRGISVSGPAGAGNPPSGLQQVASVHSPPLVVLLTKMLRPSNNFRAELLGKLVGLSYHGVPGKIAKGASAIEAWAQSMAGVQLTAYDGSGLSYSNRVAPAGMVRLLGRAESLSWSDALLEALPEPGQGTLGGRLSDIPVEAKTGTLTEISALSGWVYLQQTGTWAEFSIMSRGMSTDAAKALEDKIVRIMWKHAV